MGPSEAARPKKQREKGAEFFVKQLRTRWGMAKVHEVEDVLFAARSSKTMSKSALSARRESLSQSRKRRLPANIMSGTGSSKTKK